MNSIQTPRLLLRSWIPADADDFYAYASNPDVGPHAGWEPHRSRQDSLFIIKSVFMRAPYHWAIILKEEDRLIGNIGITKDPKRSNPRAMVLGYSLSKEHWGHGYMTEAAQAIIQFGFTTLNMDILSVYHYTDNTRSKRVIEKCGFTYEGTLRKCSSPYKGALHDDACYSMTREDFLLGFPMQGSNEKA